MDPQKSVFISYSHRDTAFKERLGIHLESPPLRNLFKAWDDAEIRQGERWRKRIQEAMDAATVAVLLISADFLASRFIQDVEVRRLSEREEQEGLILLPVIVKPCLWRRIDWLDEMLAYPRDGSTLSAADPEHERELHYAKICEEIARYVVDQPRAGKEAEEGLEESLELQEISAGEPWAKQPLEDRKGRYTEHGVRWFMESTLEGRERVVDVIKLLATTRQRTWLLATTSAVYCILDDERTRAGDRLIQWRQTLAQAASRVRVRPSSRYKHLGLVDVGSRKNWLYSKSLWQQPSELDERIVGMIETARQR